jgi:peptidoglycan pentaglycine glycine transferase (the first glycine)
MPLLKATEWDSFLARYPQSHVLQTAAWGDLKSEFGWSVERVVQDTVGAQVLFRNLPLGFSLAYIPKGPVGGEDGIGDRIRAWQALWPEIDHLCRERKAILLKIEPDSWQQGEAPGGKPDQFRPATQAIQPPRTIIVDLQGEEDDLLARMKQKTRYNIRLALKKNVIVRSSSNLELFSDLMEITGERNEFGVHSQEYYRRAFDLFYPRGECQLLVAEFNHQPLAAIMVFLHGKRAWYFYGASTNLQRQRMPTYLLQWEAIRWARAQGCSQYDLWGIPDEDEDVLEQEFTSRSDGLWGVYRFKRGFGGQVCRALGPWDRVYQPVLYAFYRWWVERREIG